MPQQGEAQEGKKKTGRMSKVGGGQHLALTVGWRMCTQRWKTCGFFKMQQTKIYL
jgi:hypothetical protein